MTRSPTERIAAGVVLAAFFAAFPTFAAWSKYGWRGAVLVPFGLLAALALVAVLVWLLGVALGDE